MTTKNNEKTIKAIQFLSNTDVDFFNLIDFEQILFNAVLKNNIKAIEYLLDNDVDIHAQNDRALLLACCNSKLEVVKYLVERGADIYADECGAFRWAANHGVAESV
ncbi:ankyrin repeat domain-containing protein, partial [Burkholderia cenocepacia]|uniref:ankyrin repeat domain-containing protein n=1 Tax=Burkholderia cenocepacia TaxID=95486 RepID=UPI001178737D